MRRIPAGFSNREPAPLTGFIPTAYAEGLDFKFSDWPTVTITLPDVSPESYDLDKLAVAVSYAETSGCADGTAIHRNNCFGIMQWDKNGNRSPRYFPTQAASFTSFKAIWKKSYGRFPDRALATKWTGNDHPDEWLATVCKVYPHPSCTTL